MGSKHAFKNSQNFFQKVAKSTKKSLLHKLFPMSKKFRPFLTHLDCFREFAIKTILYLKCARNSPVAKDLF